MTLGRIGRFRVERRLGTGSFATVWLARDEDLDAWVAIKILADNWSFNDDARRRFLEEARALRHLDNDHIVRVYEVGRLPDDRPYMVMEYADRGTLEDRLRLVRGLGRRLGVREALGFSLEIAECLTSVHASRIVHRDVKPSNVLFRSLSPEAKEALRRNGRPVPEERTLLGDFGIARRLEGMLGHTLVLGSPAYMAPEQADPERAAHADERCDVYSAAVVLYESLAGRVPFRFETVADLQRSDEPQTAVPLPRLREDVPAEVAGVVHRGLARDPAERFASAWEWRDALRVAAQAAPADDRAEAGPPAASVATGVMAREGTTDPVVAAAGRAEGTTVAEATRVRTAGLERHGGEPRWPSSARPSRAAPPAPVRESEPAGEAVPAPSPGPRHVRLPAAGAMAAALLGVVAVFFPWRVDARGTAFPEGSMLLVWAGVVFLLGLRMWRTERRWIAILSSGFAVGLGLAGVGFVVYTMLAVQGARSGLLLSLVATILASGSGYAAIARLRRDPRPWPRPAAA